MYVPHTRYSLDTSFLPQIGATPLEFKPNQPEYTDATCTGSCMRRAAIDRASQLLTMFSDHLSRKILLIMFFPTWRLPEFNYIRRPTDWLDAWSFHFSI